MFNPTHYLGVMKMHLQLGVWCQLGAQHRIRIRINVGAIVQLFLLLLRTQNPTQLVLIGSDCDSNVSQIWLRY